MRKAFLIKKDCVLGRAWNIVNIREGVAPRFSEFIEPAKAEAKKPTNTEKKPAKKAKRK